MKVEDILKVVVPIAVVGGMALFLLSRITPPSGGAPPEGTKAEITGIQVA
jgi:hypothetical protein